SMSWKKLTTMINRPNGATLHGLFSTAEYFSSPRSRLPQEGRGSATPSPRIPRLASLRMKMGMETQNWAYSTGFRFGKTCRRSRRHPRQPQARACRTNSEFRKVRVPAHTTRAEGDQPNRPSRANVITTEVIGGSFSGNIARTVSNKNSHGKERDKSVAPIATRSHHPPR